MRKVQIYVELAEEELESRAQTDSAERATVYAILALAKAVEGVARSIGKKK